MAADPNAALVRSAGFPSFEERQRAEGLRQLQTSLRGDVLPEGFQTPALEPIQAPNLDFEEPNILTRILAGRLRAKTGVDFLASSRREAVQGAFDRFESQFAGQQSVDLDAIAATLPAGPQRDAYLQRVEALSPLQRGLLEARTPGAFASIPAEQLKLFVPGAGGAQDAVLRAIEEVTRAREGARAVGNAEAVAAANVGLERLYSRIGVGPTTQLSPGGLLVDEATGRTIAAGIAPTTTVAPGSQLRNSQTGELIAQGALRATQGQNLVFPGGRVSAIVPGTREYADALAAGATVLDTVTVAPGGTVVDPATGAVFAVGASPVVRAQNLVLPNGETAAFLPGSQSYIDAIGDGARVAPTATETTVTELQAATIRDLESDSVRLRSSRESLILSRNKFLQIKEEFGLFPWLQRVGIKGMDVLQIAGDEDKDRLRRHRIARADMQRFWLDSIRLQSGVAVRPDEHERQKLILPDPNGLSGTEAEALFDGQIQYMEFTLARHFAFRDQGLMGINPWDVSTEDVRAYFSEQVATTIDVLIREDGLTETEARARAVAAVADVVGVMPRSIDGILRFTIIDSLEALNARIPKDEE